MEGSLVLRLAAFSLLAHGCYRYVVPAYSTVAVSAAVPTNLRVAYEEPAGQGIWLQHTEFGPVWLPSESAGASSLWAEPGRMPRIGDLAWSPALSQWVWLDADADVRPLAYVASQVGYNYPQAGTVLFVRGTTSGVRYVDDRMKPVRPLARSL
jgi:hypothetical protein